jgi:hypothetical protein
VTNPERNVHLACPLEIGLRREHPGGGFRGEQWQRLRVRGPVGTMRRVRPRSMPSKAVKLAPSRAEIASLPPVIAA